MTELDTLTLRLAEAEDALHTLVTAKTAVDVSDGTRTVRYSYGPASIGQLREYIADLKGRIAAIRGERSRHAIGVRF